MIKAFVVIFLILIIANIFSQPDCRYSNFSGAFTFEEMNFKERNFQMCKGKFELFKSENKVDTVLFRLYGKNYWKFWNYRSYLFSEKFRLPFISWEEVQQRRGAVNYKTGFQDF